MKEISDFLKKGVDLGDFPGAAYAIVDVDGSIDMDYVGYRQLMPEKIKNDGTEIYDCASLTKVICTTSMVMKLIEDNQLSLDTHVSNILPRFRHDQITIKDLLTHSSGLPADIPKAKTLVDENMVFDQIYDFDLVYPRGEKVLYSDIGFILLGKVIERLTAKSLDDYANQVVFKPLGMEDSSYHPDKRRVAPTEYRDDDVYKGLLKGQVHDEKAFALGGVAGHAGLFSTVKDLSKFILSILRNDGQILRPDSVDSLFPLQITYQVKEGLVRHRSLGWNKPTKGGTAGQYVHFEHTILHTGFTGCNLWIDRLLGLGFVMLSNAVHPQREKNEIIKYRYPIANMVVSLRRKV